MAEDALMAMERNARQFQKGNGVHDPSEERAHRAANCWAGSQHIPKKTAVEAYEKHVQKTAASRVREPAEVDLCGGSGRYLGVSCPGCKGCG